VGYKSSQKALKNEHFEQKAKALSPSLILLFLLLYYCAKN